jgi:L-lactate dehydrogenase
VEQRNDRGGSATALAGRGSAPTRWCGSRSDLHWRRPRGKGATNYAVGLAGARIVEAVVHDEKLVMPVSSMLDNYAGISDVCLSMPSVVDRSGVQTVLPVPLSDAETEGLRRSADTVRAVIRKLGL